MAELLVVDKDAIFMENVGATVELSKRFEEMSTKVFLKWLPSFS